MERLEAVLLDKVLKSSVFSACEKCQRSRRMVGGEEEETAFVEILRVLDLSFCLF